MFHYVTDMKSIGSEQHQPSSSISYTLYTGNDPQQYYEETIE